MQHTDVIQIASEVYNSDKQLSIMQSLSATATAATAVQNPSISELHMLQVKHSKRRPPIAGRGQGTCKSYYYSGAAPSHPKVECPVRDTKCYKCGKKGHFKSSCRSKKEEKEVCRAKTWKESRNWQKSMSWRYKWWQGLGHNSLCSTTQPVSTKRITGSDIPPIDHCTSEQPQQAGEQQAHQTTVVDNMSQGTGPQIWLWSWYWSRVQHHAPVHLHINFRDGRPELPKVIITRYGDSLVANTGSCTAILLSGCQAPRKAMFQVTDTRGVPDSW